MQVRTHLLLPDRWRVELLRRPREGDAWLAALEALPWAVLLDWASPRPSAGDLLLVAGLDLAAAELVLKLPPDVRVYAADTSWALLPFGGRAQVLRRAGARIERRLVLPHRRRGLPAAPVPYLAALMKAAGLAS